ncbi:MAG: ABC-type branched-subunit amino acid transport system ATPase component, partial [Natronomonas sp.]
MSEGGAATELTGEVDRHSDSLLAVRNLDAGYGDLQILTDVDLDVDPGEYVTIVGPNGAGKSTIMKSVFGLTSHMGGTVTYDGQDITGLK